MKYPNVLLLVKEIDLYFFPYIQNCECYAVLENGKFGQWTQKINQFDLIIFLDYGFMPYMATFVRSLSNARMILFLWNYVDNEKIELLNKVRVDKAIDDIYTFDKIDALKHHLNHNTTFYTVFKLEKNEQIEYDVYFGGSNQDRKNKIMGMKTVFEQQNIRFMLHCPDIESEEKSELSYISYYEYLIKTLKSKAILEILKEGQSGISLRTLESMYFNKLLITSNRFIKYYQFYNPNNIFIIGEDNFSDLSSFLKNKYQRVDSNILQFYNLSNWIERFIVLNEDLMNQYEFNTPLFLSNEHILIKKD